MEKCDGEHAKASPYIYSVEVLPLVALPDLPSCLVCPTQERDKLAVTADDGARLQLMRKERNQKQTQLDMLVNNRRQRLTALIACVSTGRSAPHKKLYCLC